MLTDLSVAVLVPFAQKFGGTVNGYRVGSWPFERLGGERPIGFLEVTRRTASLPLSRHLTLGDFVTHDNQSQWPRYVVVSPRLLDKLELVVDEIAQLRGVRDPLRISVNVHSGFRTPLHNAGVEGSALNSRHQYGDAADVAIDADGDGRFTSFDSRVVGLAVEMVERRHPDMAGGVGDVRQRAVAVRAHRCARATGAVVAVGTGGLRAAELWLGSTVRRWHLSARGA